MRVQVCRPGRSRPQFISLEAFRDRFYSQARDRLLGSIPYAYVHARYTAKVDINESANSKEHPV